MKKRIADESAVNMPLFFGLVGLINVVFLWPGFFILHWTGVERFEMLPAGRVTTIVLLNAMASCVADLAWGYAIVMTSPIVVTVGLSMTIPLSLIGQTVLNSQTSSLLYWVGAIMVVASFLFVNQEGGKDEQTLPRKTVDMWTHDASISDYD
jgi:solute carrier family 35 protein F5